MRILTALTYYHPHWTGLSVYAQRIAEGLAQRGHDVTVLTSQFDRDLARREVVGGVAVVRVPTAGRLSRGVVMPTFPVVARRLIARHDIVHVHSPMPEAATLVSMARRAGRPSVLTHQGDVVMPAGALNHIVQAAMSLSLASAIRRADAVTTHSDDYAGHSRSLANRAGPVIGIAPPTVIPEPDPIGVAAWRRELGLGDRPVVGFAGRFVEEKGFDYLLRAVPLVLASIPDAMFLFAGETNVVYEQFYDRCRPLLEANAAAVRSVGLLLDRQRLADFYAACDLFVLPSRTDCFAAVQLEAMLCGTPVVASDIPGARDVVTMTGFGRLVRPHDPAALASGIVAELTARRERPRREDVVATFDPERAIARYEAVLQDAVGSPHRPVDHRRPPEQRPPSTLDDADRRVLDRVLGNEADMAFRRRVPRLVDFLDLHDGERVLDAGCGMGVLSMTMRALRDVRIVAVDGDRERLGWAARECVPAHLAHVDLSSLPFADATFDKVLLAEVLEHLDDDVAALTEIARVTAPGGTVAISVPHANYPWRWDPINRSKELFGLRPRTKPGGITGQWSGHRRLYLPRQLAAVIERAGLVPDAIEEQTAHTAPLSHVLVYSIGKPLVERNLLPTRLRVAADRFRGAANPGSRLNPINLGVAALRRYDRRNEHPRGDETRFVGIVARAVKP